MCGVAGVLDLAGLRMVPEEIIAHLWEENQEGMFERLRGIDHIFTFAAMPGPITCFEGVQACLLLTLRHF